MAIAVWVDSLWHSHKQFIKNNLFCSCYTNTYEHEYYKISKKILEDHSFKKSFWVHIFIICWTVSSPSRPLRKILSPKSCLFYILADKLHKEMGKSRMLHSKHGWIFPRKALKSKISFRNLGSLRINIFVCFWTVCI